MLNPFRFASRAVGACALAWALQAPAHAVPVLEMSSTTTATGIDLTVSVLDVEDLYAYQFSLNFDPTLLAALGGSEATFLSSAGPTFFHAGDIDNTAGTIAFAFSTLLGPTDGVDGSGELATISFDVVQAGLANFSFSEVVLVDSIGADIPVELRGLAVPVPEPASLWLATLGLLTVVGGRKIRTALA